MQITNSNAPTWKNIASSRSFGGASTTPRRANGIAYAWRLHRRARKADPFFFTLSKTRGSAGDGLVRPELPRRLKRQGAKGGQFAPSFIAGFVTRADRERGIQHFADQGYNHFTLFKDVNAEYALMVGMAAGSWLAPGQVWVNR